MSLMVRESMMTLVSERGCPIAFGGGGRTVTGDRGPAVCVRATTVQRDPSPWLFLLSDVGSQVT